MINYWVETAKESYEEGRVLQILERMIKLLD